MTLDLLWACPPTLLALEPTDVHLWRATVEVSVPHLKIFEGILSSEEKDKAHRFLFERDRHCFVVARGFLRAILSRYLNCTPNELHFEYTNGKPSITRSYGNLKLNFNLAHSGTLALYGITVNRAIGVDLEQIRDKFASEEIARQFFSPSEVDKLLSLSPGLRRRAFFECWTRKEAFVKAKGCGLSLPLDQFDVSVSPEAAQLLETRWDKNEVSRWSLRAIDVDPGYASTVAVEGHYWRPRYFQASINLFESLP